MMPRTNPTGDRITISTHERGHPDRERERRGRAGVGGLGHHPLLHSDRAVVDPGLHPPRVIIASRAGQWSAYRLPPCRRTAAFGAGGTPTPRCSVCHPQRMPRSRVFQSDEPATGRPSPWAAVSTGRGKKPPSRRPHGPGRRSGPRQAHVAAGGIIRSPVQLRHGAVSPIRVRDRGIGMTTHRIRPIATAPNRLGAPRRAEDPARPCRSFP